VILSDPPAEVEEGATVRVHLTERSTMIVFGPVLAILSIGFLCWPVFTLAVYVAGHIRAFLAWRRGHVADVWTSGFGAAPVS
jgi:hypothetical protein